MKNVRMEATLKGKTYAYMGKMAYCNDCNSEIYIGEIIDYNLDALYKARDKLKERI